ncbi:hypothetical protein CFAL_03065 [Corynebacterium falsenii DSM 44353]|uniref:hypothetical protein n=1 Tax=Corynebacterium falsenii TaxID=108486 RepID=UPI0003E926DA|nr:hypothetical protein [Corynebacterium falsenii]AHI04242.1 hypothetical protein CFAL_03065 [Corynebacterium falsenii DSM 44353]UBI05492.1 hypothetical protein LA343_04990 [Corynebacterium falsenii]
MPTEKTNATAKKLSKRTIMTGVIAAATLPLLGCGESDEWESQAQRNKAFQEYACVKMETENPDIVAGRIMSKIDSTQAGRVNLFRQTQMVIRGAIEPTCDTSSPYYIPEFEQLWRESLEESEGDSFKPSTAREAGITVN